MTIHLGYEVGTGKAVTIPLRHLAVTGQTQESGKTTTLEALITRSGLSAVAFLTKRGEASFHRARRIPPYFRERTDWQFVRSILEATLRQGMKFQTSWIIKLCEARAGRNEKWAAPKSLADVRRNVTQALESARGLNESVYTELGAYLDIVVPQIDSLPRSNRLDLEPGINVMDLTAYSMELQALVMRSVLEWVYERERDVITIIPEAWEFIPQARSSPVLLAAEQLIRKGAASKNYVWCDSQDIAGVHKSVLRQVGVWILGVQREIHEAKRTIEHIPVGSPKPKVQDIMTLGKGQFFVGFEDRMTKVYVMPYWLPEIEAQAIARGQSRVESAAQFRPTGHSWQSAEGSRQKAESSTQSAVGKQQSTRSIAELEDEVWREQYETEKRERERLQAEVTALKASIDGQARELNRLRGEKRHAVRVEDRPVAPDASAPNRSAADCQLPTADLNGFYEQFKSRLLRDAAVLSVLAARPEIEVSITRPVISVDGKTARGLCATLIAEGYFNEARNAYAGYIELTERRCKSIAKATYYSELEALAEMGFLTRSTDATRKVFYQAVEGMKIRILNGEC